MGFFASMDAFLMDAKRSMSVAEASTNMYLKRFLKEQPMNYFLMPDYYKDFSCKKGDCRFSCCKGWKVTFSLKFL